MRLCLSRAKSPRAEDRDERPEENVDTNSYHVPFTVRDRRWKVKKPKRCPIRTEQTLTGRHELPALA